ncbi:PRTRC system protein C [Paraflavitalea sp. CAU 1676]|uniref:PRTRC system protein C n=1 Tax=Paraflavitalea sp. CAU 1676 TaxID=3032598 RepID=UPI0023D98090|nr:PRTRC system protein C [Paraflavitalea sp. CAU 1676]MDF2189318.1 PRTRC system protein C [Paraflavitalea sp. CAU 1676]
MALQVTSLKRAFKMKKDGKEIILPDPNPDMTIEEVLQFHSGSYPELTTSTISGPVPDGNKAVYTFKTTVGTKG